MRGVTDIHQSSAITVWVVNTVGFIKNMMISFNIWFTWQIYLDLKRFFFPCYKHWNWIPVSGLLKPRVTFANYFLNDCHCHWPFDCSWRVYATSKEGIHTGTVGMDITEYLELSVQWVFCLGRGLLEAFVSHLTVLWQKALKLH